MKSKKLLFLSAACLVAVISCSSNNRGRQQKQTLPQVDSVITSVTADAVTINTTTLSRDVIGFNGTTPVEITLSKGKITGIRVLQNNETPSFLNRAQTVLNAFTGKTAKEGANLAPDAVSGATYSSKSLITNVQRGLKYASEHGIK